MLHAQLRGCWPGPNLSVSGAAAWLLPCEPPGAVGQGGGEEAGLP